MSEHDFTTYDFSFGGVTATSKGIKLSSPIIFSAAVPRIKTIEIPGRSGALHIDEGAYNSRVGTAKCYTIDTAGAPNRMADISAFLFKTNALRKLVPSDDPDHFWYARVANGAEIASRLGILAPFTIEFECFPFRYTTDAETIINYTSSTQVLSNPTGFDAFPLIYVTASGAGTISNSNGEISILESTGSAEIVIDTEDQRAYYNYAGGDAADDILQWDSVPFISAINDGSWGFTFSNTLTLRVAPRWRTL